jgi:hypothetical protein
MATTQSYLPYALQAGFGIPFDDDSDIRRLCTETAKRVVSKESKQIARRFLQSVRVESRCGYPVDEFVQVCSELMNFRDRRISVAPNRFHDFGTFVEAWFANIEECLYWAANHNQTFALSLRPIARNNSYSIKPVDDVYYIASARLHNEMLVLPEPQTVEDVLRMRNAKEIARFREVFASWCEALKQGDAAAEQAMRSDVRKANRELTRLKRWKEWNSSPLNFYLNAIGGHIPFFQTC